MGLRGFLTRRLIRLHPMVIMGFHHRCALAFLTFGAVRNVSVDRGHARLEMLLVMAGGLHDGAAPAFNGYSRLAGNVSSERPRRGHCFFRVPSPTCCMPWWCGTFPKNLLAVLVLLAAGGSHPPGIGRVMPGDFAGGWSVDGQNLHIGFTRLMFPFFSGLLLFRLGKILRVPHAFWVCSALIVVVLTLPRFGGEAHYWMNGLYEALCIILIFPLIVALGAGGTLGGRYSAGICDFMGRISYPIYITPLLADLHLHSVCEGAGIFSLTQTYPYALLVFFGKPGTGVWVPAVFMTSHRGNG